MNNLVTLNETEKKMATYIGRKRNAECIKAGVATKKVDPVRSDEEIHIHGAGAEIAFAKMFNVFPDTNKY